MKVKHAKNAGVRTNRRDNKSISDVDKIKTKYAHRRCREKKNELQPCISYRSAIDECKAQKKIHRIQQTKEIMNEYTNDNPLGIKEGDKVKVKRIGNKGIKHAGKIRLVKSIMKSKDGITRVRFQDPPNSYVFIECVEAIVERQTEEPERYRDQEEFYDTQNANATQQISEKTKAVCLINMLQHQMSKLTLEEKQEINEMMKHHRDW